MSLRNYFKKEGSDIFPQTIEMIARGRFALDEQDHVYVDGQAVPQGYREDHGSSAAVAGRYTCEPSEKIS